MPLRMSALSSTVTPVALVRRPAEAPTTTNTYKVALNPARLYANDLDALLRYLSEGGREVQLRAGAGDSVLLDGAEDLLDLTPKERGDLRIKVIDPPIEVRLSDGTSWVTTPISGSQPPADAKKLVDDTARLIDQWASGTARINSREVRNVAILASVMGLTPSIALLISKGWTIQIAALLGTALGFFLLIFLVSLSETKHRVVVSHRTRYAARELRGQAWGAVLIAMLGGVAGSVSTWLLALKP